MPGNYILCYYVIITLIKYSLIVKAKISSPYESWVGCIDYLEHVQSSVVITILLINEYNI